MQENQTENQKPSIMSLLGSATPVTLVGNENVEGRPLVTPTLDEIGQPRLDPQGRAMGSIRLEQMVNSLNNKTFFNTRRRVAFIAGVQDELQAWVDTNGYEEGSQFPGRITITEDIKPFYKRQSPKSNPQTQTVIGVEVGKKFYPVYMQMTYGEDMNEKDRFVRDAKDVAKLIAENGDPFELVNDAPKIQTAETAAIPQD